MCPTDGSGDTLGLQEKAPSREKHAVLKKKANKLHVASRNSSSPTRSHTSLNKDPQRKGTTRTHGSMAHVSVLGLVLLVCCSMIQQMAVEAKDRAPEEDRVN